MLYQLKSDCETYRMKPQTSLPKFVQISELLIREIAAGRYQRGDRLPPERALAAELNVAVGTLRKALDDLQAKGVLERRHGSGNYIAATGDIPSIYSFFRLEKPGGGGLPTARVLSVELMDKPAELAELGPYPTVWRIRRIRSLDGVDVAAEEIWLDGRCARTLSPKDMSESLYLHYRERLNIWILRVVDRLGAAAAPDWAGPCGMAAGDIAAEARRESYDQNDDCVEVSVSYFNPARARYVARIR